MSRFCKKIGSRGKANRGGGYLPPLWRRLPADPWGKDALEAAPCDEGD